MRLLKGGFALAVVLFAVNEQTAQAATVTATLQAKVTVNKVCHVSATDMNFGVYDPSATAHEDTSTVTVRCTKRSPYDVGLDKGANGASVTTRQMKHSTLTDLLNYSLFSEATRTTNWGDTVGVDTVNVASATGNPTDHTVYGRVPAGQYVSAGSYSDTITVTVTY